MENKNLIDIVKRIYDKEKISGALAASIITNPIYTWVHNVYLNNTDWETIKVRVINSLLTIAILPPFLEFAKITSRKLGMKDDSLPQNLYIVGLGLVITGILKYGSNYLGLDETNTEKIGTNTAVSTAAAATLIPFTLYLAKVTPQVLGYSKNKLEKMPESINKLVNNYKKEIICGTIVLSLLASTSILAFSKYKKEESIIPDNNQILIENTDLGYENN